MICSVVQWRYTGKFGRCHVYGGTRKDEFFDHLTTAHTLMEGSLADMVCCIDVSSATAQFIKQVHVTHLHSHMKGGSFCSAPRLIHIGTKGDQVMDHTYITVRSSN